MPSLAHYPTPSLEREAFAGGYTANGTALLTLDELSAYDPGRGKGAERLFKCPFCGTTERAFHVNAQSGRFNCKRASCGVKGVLREFWTDTPKLTGRARASASLKRAFEVTPLSSGFAPELAAQSQQEEVPDKSNWRSQWEQAFTLDSPEAAKGREYLAGRKVDLETAIRAGVRFSRHWAPSPAGRTYRGGAAILFPMRNFTGELQAVNGRFLNPLVFADENTGKSQTVKALTGGNQITGAFWAAPQNDFDWRTADALALVEGQVDALALAACGVPTLAVGGGNLPAWIARAVAFKAVAIASDNDQAGEAAAEKWFNQISTYTQRSFRLRPFDGCKDFGEAMEDIGRDALIHWLIESAPQLPLREANPQSGAARICEVLQRFPRLLRAAHFGELPTQPVQVPSPFGDAWKVEDAAAAVKEIDRAWTARARSCIRAKRDLNALEIEALEMASDFLDGVAVTWDGDEWLDLLSSIALTG